MPDIFISCRRGDSAGHAGRLFDCVRERFGDEAGFMDVTEVVAMQSATDAWVTVRAPGIAAAGYAVGGDEYRLFVNEVPLAPTTFPIQVLTNQSELSSDVVFVIPSTAKNTVLQ